MKLDIGTQSKETSYIVTTTNPPIETIGSLTQANDFCNLEK